MECALGPEGAREARDQSNEERRLQAVLERAKGRPYAQLLHDFVDAMRTKGSADRTLRLYAGVAQTFCERAGVDSRSGWGADAVLTFLKHTPGAAASLSPFVGFCRRNRGWEVSMPTKRVRREEVGLGQHAVDRLRRALDSARGRPVDDLKLLEVVRVIAAATGLSHGRLLSVRIPGTTSIDNGSILLAVDAQIEPGHPLHPYAVRWRRLIEAGQVPV